MATVSLRARKEIDYAELENAGTDSIYGTDAARFKTLLDSKLPGLNSAQGRVTAIQSTAFSLEWIRRHGLKTPVLISGRQGLGMKVPCPDFSVKDVARVVGPDWPLDVIDVAAQSELHGWSLGSWASYYHAPPDSRASVLNVISLEFSGTPLTKYVRSPRVVRQLDWIDTVWPGRRRGAGEFPSVQYYCLMSVAGSWTDFHVDFGGTSVWYHVHTGCKLFLFLPPTPSNLSAYEGWTGSPDQGLTFLPDTLGEGKGGAFAVTVPQGGTLLIPTGWIHAVYTPADSLVFGGNFLHGLDMLGQLRIYELEQASKVGRKYRFPYYEHMQWYAAGYYVQFTRLPEFKALLREAISLAAGGGGAGGGGGEGGAGQSQDGGGSAVMDVEGGEAVGDGSPPPSSSSSTSSRAAALSSLLLSLSALGLSLHELTGLPSLLNVLAGLREGLRRREEGGQAHGHAVTGSGSATSAAPAPSGGLKLKLKIGGGGGGGVAAKPRARQAGIKGAVLVQRTPSGQGGAAGSSSSSLTKVMTTSAAPQSLLGEDEYDVFPASAAAAEAAILAGVESGPEGLLEELAHAIDVDAEASDAGQGRGEGEGEGGPTRHSVLAIHAPPGAPTRHRVAGPLYSTHTWSKLVHVPHVPPVASVGEAELQAAAVGAACGFGLYGGGLPTFEGEGGEETSGADVVKARIAADAAGDAASAGVGGRAGKHLLAGGTLGGKLPPGKRGRFEPAVGGSGGGGGGGVPEKRRKDGDEVEGGRAGQGDEDEDYERSGSSEEEEASDEDSELDKLDEESNAGGELDGEGELEGDGQDLVEVKGILQEKARDEALLKILEDAAERKRLARLANKEAATLLGNVRIPIKRRLPTAGGEAGGVTVAVATSSSGQTRKLVCSQTLGEVGERVEQVRAGEAAA